MSIENTALLLNNCGREMADSLLTSAVTQAKTPDQMSNQLHVLRQMAICILAAHLYNAERQLNQSPEDEAAAMMDDIYGELNHMKESDVELKGPGPV